MKNLAILITQLIVLSPGAHAQVKPDKIVPYKEISGGTLSLHIFNPPGHTASDHSSAIVFFFGGGWTHGTPVQFYKQSRYLASRGMVAICAEYRTQDKYGTTPAACVRDGKSAIRWVRSHASELGIDPDWLAAGGGSSGGQIAAATGTGTSIDEASDDTSVSCRPDALVLFNPVIDNSQDGYGYDRVKDYWQEFSPMHNIDRKTPPTIIFLGTNDRFVPVATAKEYKRRMEEKGLLCELHLYEGQPHGFFNKAKYRETLLETDKFLTALGYIDKKPVSAISAEADDPFAPAPLYLDPVYDGAADPSIVWNRQEKNWTMFYTNRRANVDSLTEGVRWVHGTRIGMAVSRDRGRTWTYKDTCDIGYRMKDVTYWAPDVIYNEGLYHMFLTVVPGIFDNWSHPRYIIHLTSKDLEQWDFQSKLDLANDKCIDACVFPMPDGSWRLYYNNERDHKSIYYADSPDLYKWTDSGQKAIGDRSGEGPCVFEWEGKYRMVVDNWNGLGVYASTDLAHWERQPENILQDPGKRPEDGVIGQHADVVVTPEEKAFIFYFTHPGRTKQNKNASMHELRRSSIQVAELKLDTLGQVYCNRNEPVHIDLGK